MSISLEPGRYVIAVSGGVDSMALLHMLQSVPDVKLTVAHFDHGIRDDSTDDRKLVQATAKSYHLPFIYDQGRLGVGTSEAAAREARYNFLHQVQRTTGAQALITAHHEDDLLETAVINMLRGTGRKGLSSLSDRPEVRRPLLRVPKAELKNYAAQQGLVWHEDSTNLDTTILRNYVRRVLLPRLSPEARAQLLAYVRHVGVLNHAIDSDLASYLHQQPSRQTLDRSWFAQLPHSVAREVMAAWLRSHGVSFDRPAIERLVVVAKTGLPGKQTDVNGSFQLLLGKDILALTARDR